MKTIPPNLIRRLTRILRLTEKPSDFRTFFIGVLFPEINKILEELKQISLDLGNPAPDDGPITY